MKPLHLAALIAVAAGCATTGHPCFSDSVMYAICQSGTTFLCNDGRWFNLGTTCR